MKMSFRWVLGWLGAALPCGAQPVTHYYVGEAVTRTSAATEAHPYLLSRTLDRDQSRIAETVVTFQRGSFREDSSVLSVKGNQVTLHESTGTVVGQGELSGPDWQWTFLRAEFQVPSRQVRISDINVFSPGGIVFGHKEFFRASESQPWMREDVTLYPISQPTFQALRARLLAP